MKIRNGFVSNSSSTSFVLNIPLPESADKEAEIEKAIEKMFLKEESYYRRNHGDDARAEWEDDYEYEICQVRDTINKGRQILKEVEVEYGGEETVENIINIINDHFGLDIQWTSLN